MITGYTRIAGVIGDPIRHSLSPTILNAAFTASQLDWRYLAFPVKDGDASKALDAIRTLHIEGLSVTMPHKAAVAEALENLTPAAEALGAVNCVFRKDGELWGDSTDGDGLVEAVQDLQGEEAFDNKRVVVVGTGGAARSICEAIGRRSTARLFVAGRAPERVASTTLLAEGATAVGIDQISDLENIEVVINATSVGMSGGPDEYGSPIPSELLNSGQTVIDIVYQPRTTPLLAAANEAGATTMNGVPMLVHQAALGFQRWTNLSPPLEAMTRAVESELGN